MNKEAVDYVLFCKGRFSSFVSNYCSVICMMKPLITDNENSDVHRLLRSSVGY